MTRSAQRYAPAISSTYDATLAFTPARRYAWATSSGGTSPDWCSASTAIPRRSSSASSAGTRMARNGAPRVLLSTSTRAARPRSGACRGSRASAAMSARTGCPVTSRRRAGKLTAAAAKPR